MQLPLLHNGVPVGQAEYEVQGLRVRFRCSLKRNELCKLALVRGESTLLLGTPVPSNGVLRLERTLSRSELERAGVWPPERVEVLGGPQERPGPRLRDGILRMVFGQERWQWSRWEGGFVASCFWRENTPFPAMPLFCLTHLERERDGWQVRCWLDGEGNPCFPPDRRGGK